MNSLNQTISMGDHNVVPGAVTLSLNEGIEQAVAHGNPLIVIHAIQVRLISDLTFTTKAIAVNLNTGSDGVARSVGLGGPALGKAISLAIRTNTVGM